MPPSGNDKDKAQQPSGRVRHDSGGRAVWEWAVDSGRHAIDSTSRLLKKLNIADLRLLGDDEQTPGSAPPGSKSAGQKAAAPKPSLSVEGDRQGGFDPYNSRTPTGRGVNRGKAPTTPPKPRVTQPVRPKKTGLLARLFGRD